MNKEPVQQLKGDTEFTEQRALAERNTTTTAVTRTQSQGETVSGLDRIRAAAKREPHQKFNNLYHHLTKELLHQAYYELKRNAAAGVDQIKWQDYADKLDERLETLHTQLQSGSYKPQPSLRAWICKENGKQRPIGIAALEDKIVQQALKSVLEPIYEEEFMGYSYGFRPKRSQHKALDALYMAITEKQVSWILDADISGFFRSLRSRLDDEVYSAPNQ
jgi:RNA-directed DNA polymerase